MRHGRTLRLSDHFVRDLSSFRQGTAGYCRGGPDRAAQFEDTTGFAYLWVSNSLSGRHWQLNQTPAVRHPPHIVEVCPGHRAIAGDGQRRVALQRRVAPRRIVVGLEVGELPFKVAGRSRTAHDPGILAASCRSVAPRTGDRGTWGTVLISSISRSRRFAVHRCASNSGS